MKSFFDEMPSSWVLLTHFSDIKTGMGNIAATASTYPYFCKQLIAFLNDDNA